MKRDVIFAAAIENRPDRCGQRDDEHPECQHPVKSFVAATAVRVNERELDMENMSGGPEGDLPHRPKRRGIGNINFGDRKKIAEDLIAKAEKSEVDEAESE